MKRRRKQPTIIGVAAEGIRAGDVVMFNEAGLLARAVSAAPPIPRLSMDKSTRIRMDVGGRSFEWDAIIERVDVASGTPHEDVTLDGRRFYSPGLQTATATLRGSNLKAVA